MSEITSHPITNLAQVGGSHHDVCMSGINYWQNQEKIDQTWKTANQSTLRNYMDYGFGKQQGTDSLFIRGYLKADDDMEAQYRNIHTWKRPSEFAVPAIAKTSKNPNADAKLETCSGVGCSEYRGKQNQTISGRTCKSWTNWVQKYPNGGLADNNYCRNPDGDNTIWCFTTDPLKKWEYCKPLNVVNLEVCTGINCDGYRGEQTKTKSGYTCRDWNLQVGKYKPSNNPGKGLDSNFCRNPDGDVSIWCFTTDPNKQWENCKPLDKATVVDSSPANKPSLWGNGYIKPAGVQQGSLGDCWFLAVGAALAEHPQRVRKLFENAEYPENGAFKIHFFQRGEPVNVVVDDTLPLNAYNLPVNAKESTNGAWWMPILEKAYAKYNVFYANINGGTPLQSFRDLTGMPTKRFTSSYQSTAELFQTIRDADKRQWAMSAACQVRTQGLESAHAYTILDAVTLTHGGQQWDLLKMRNPWAMETYSGAWSDLDSRWTPENRKKVNFVDSNDGVFYLPIQTFRHAFPFYYIGMYQNWQVERFFVGPKDKGQQFNKYVTSKVDQEAWVTIDWMAARRYPAKCDDLRQKHDYNIFVTDYSRNVRLQEGTFNDIGYGWYQFAGGIKAGVSYKIMIHDFETDQNHDFTVTVYSEKSPVELSDRR